MDLNILVERKWKKADYTIGKLYTDGDFLCNTLEDTDRGLVSSMSPKVIASKKVYGQTAIPTGKYQVVLAWSNKFKKQMPLITRVPGYSGVLIHAGNTNKDTLGCVLVGKNDVVGKVTNSRYWFNILFTKIKEAINRGNKVWLTIK